MSLKANHYLYLAVSFLFLAICSVNLFSDGMFMDGLLYADIARNMAQGLGSFWQPHLSNTFFNEFYEHPPLALGLQSLWFRVFGDSIYVERFYSLSTFVLVGYLIVLIWEQIVGDKKMGWLPLFFWILITDVSWAIANNMLENTMTIFVCLSTYAYLKSLKKHHYLWLLIAGVSLSLGWLSKGFTCLYVWALPALVWLFKKPTKFPQAALDTVLIIAFTALPILLLFFFNDAAHHNMEQYFNRQVLGSIQNVQTVDSRWAILGEYFENVLVPLVIGGIILLISHRKRTEQKPKGHAQYPLLLLILTLCGVLPIMISLKQRGFYILTVYPLFAIAWAYYLLPNIKALSENIKHRRRALVWLKGITIVLIIAGLSLSLLQINRVGRDKDMIHDTKAILEIVEPNSTLGMCSSMRTQWSLHGYFSRYGNVSLSTQKDDAYPYFVSMNNCDEKYLKDYYEVVNIETKRFKLYRLKE